MGVNGYEVEILDTVTGETRWKSYPYEWNDGFWWTAGNFSCDCNRAAAFMRAGGEEPSEKYWDEVVCSAGNRYRVPRVRLADGTVLTVEGAGPWE
jgi:hypothetical protein